MIKKQASEQKYKMIVVKDVTVKMRDGIIIPVDVYCPDAPGKYQSKVMLPVIPK